MGGDEERGPKDCLRNKVLSTYEYWGSRHIPVTDNRMARLGFVPSLAIPILLTQSGND